MPATDFANVAEDRITLQRLNLVTDAYEELADTPHVWCVAEPQGDATFRFRIRYRGDLRTKADISPAMRVIYLDEELDLLDAVETVRRTEVQLIASRRIIEDDQNLKQGARRIQAWPS